MKIRNWMVFKVQIHFKLPNGYNNKLLQPLKLVQFCQVVSVFRYFFPLLFSGFFMLLDIIYLYNLEICINLPNRGVVLSLKISQSLFNDSETKSVKLLSCSRRQMKNKIWLCFQMHFQEWWPWMNLIMPILVTITSFTECLSLLPLLILS